MANVDLETKKIKGAVKGTRKYYHEEGHLKFEEEYRRGNSIRVIQELSFRMLVLVTALTVAYPALFMKLTVLTIMLVYLLSEYFEEKWCWDYADKKLLEEEAGDDKHKRITLQ